MTPIEHDEVLQLKIEHIENDLSEVKTELKQQREIMNSTIVSMGNNLAKLTTLTENQAYQLEKQDGRLERQDTVLAAIGQEITYLRVKIDTVDDKKNNDDDKSGGSKVDEDKKFLQSLVKDNWKVMLIILLVFACFFTGYKISDIAGLLG